MEKNPTTVLKLRKISQQIIKRKKTEMGLNQN